MLRTPLCVLLLLAGVVGYGHGLLSLPRKVRTKEGLVLGWNEKSAAGEKYVAFRGIPYARPPVGELRFQPPQRHPGWWKPLHAGQHGNVCPQIDTSREDPLIGDEDCLFLNVYSRNVKSWKRAPTGVPVMVFIHGGNFIQSSGDDRYYGPSYLMDEAIVLVTLNYRLGVFGFMTTHDAAAPGNYGLLDQVMALRWVRDNIAAFGGDPKAVTIFGHSAGAASVSLLVFSPLTKGLFHRAISQSGTSLANFAASGRKAEFTEELAEKLNCPTDNTGEMVKCLRQKPMQTLLDYARPDKHEYRPRVDSEVDHPLLPKDPRLLLRKGDFNLVPWMHGVTKEEGWYFAPYFAAKEFLTAIKEGNISYWGALANILSMSASSIVDCGKDPREETRKVRDFYSAAGGPGISSLLPIAQVPGDRSFIIPALVESRLASLHTQIYRYVFEYKGPGRLSWVDLSALNVSDNDPGHGDEMSYLFSQREQPLEQPGTPNHDMIRIMVGLWTSFARTGRPSSHSPDSPDWPVLDDEYQRHMRLDSVLTLGDGPFEKRANFWQTVAINEPWRHPVQQSCPAVRLAAENNTDASDSGNKLQAISNAVLAQFN